MLLQKAMHFFGQFWPDSFSGRDLLDARFAQTIDRTKFSQKQVLSVLTHARTIIQNALVDPFLEQKLMIRVRWSRCNAPESVGSCNGIARPGR